MGICSDLDLLGISAEVSLLNRNSTEEYVSADGARGYLCTAIYGRGKGKQVTVEVGMNK
ncbi:hypothetical protein [Desulfosporosinus sp. HMP52]|uniref:hypothetical protein n=1 Tax=Desulfosporosinus sp. HMP52 TaxID=1487923 RepID=UPI000A569741|nr:hypothetical protein [Desulfosporosinus sp. HMP52]